MACTYPQLKWAFCWLVASTGPGAAGKAAALACADDASLELDNLPRPPFAYSDGELFGANLACFGGLSPHLGHCGRSSRRSQRSEATSVGVGWLFTWPGML